MEQDIEIRVDTETYSKDVIWKAIEMLGNAFYFQVDMDGRFTVVKIREKYAGRILAKEAENIFFEQLNHQVIRGAIFNETKDVRNLIVGKALFETEAFDDQSKYFDPNTYPEEDNYLMDINHIADC